MISGSMFVVMGLLFEAIKIDRRDSRRHPPRTGHPIRGWSTPRVAFDKPSPHLSRILMHRPIGRE